MSLTDLLVAVLLSGKASKAALACEQCAMQDTVNRHGERIAAIEDALKQPSQPVALALATVAVEGLHEAREAAASQYALLEERVLSRLERLEGRISIEYGRLIPSTPREQPEAPADAMTTPAPEVPDAALARALALCIDGMIEAIPDSWEATRNACLNGIPCPLSLMKLCQMLLACRKSLESVLADPRKQGSATLQQWIEGMFYQAVAVLHATVEGLRQPEVDPACRHRFDEIRQSFLATLRGNGLRVISTLPTEEDEDDTDPDWYQFSEGGTGEGVVARPGLILNGKLLKKAYVTFQPELEGQTSENR